MAKKQDPNEPVRVKDKQTKAEFTRARSAVRPDRHEILDKDAVDRYGRWLPAKPHVAKGGTSASVKKSTATSEGQDANG